ncbi:cytochrome P450 [Methylobacterium oryzae CBMB20]
MDTSRTTSIAHPHKSSSPRPPGPKGWPLLGNIPAIRRDPLAFFTDCAHRYGDVVAVSFGPKTALLLSDPADIERVLLSEHAAFPKGSLFWRQVSAVFGNGLLTSSGSFWQRQRRLAAPAFAGQKLASYAEAMVRLTERMLDSWRPGATRNIHADMMALTLRIAAETLFGAQVEADVSRMDAALHDIGEETAARFSRPILIPDAIPLPGHLRYRRGLRVIEQVVTRIIAERRQDPGSDLLSAMMNARDETGAAMSDEQLRDEAITLLLAGHDTTALALTWTLYLLGRHPEADSALASEAQAVLGSRAAGIDDVARLQRTEWTVKEGMRLFPPAWIIGREAGADCLIKGFHVRAGTQLYMSPWVLNRHPRYYEAPEQFRPERWRDGLERRLPRFAYLPFGGGPRICIAHRFAMIEAVLILATIARRFRLVTDQTSPADPFPSITLSPRGGIDAQVEARRG